MAMTLFAILAAVAAGMSGAAPPPDHAPANASTNASFLAKNYPAESLKRGEQGKVGFQLSFDADGGLVSCLITQSSGFVTLDNGTCEMLSRSAKIAPVRDAEGRRVSSVRSGYVDWKLPASGVRLARAGPAVATKNDPLVCKRSSVPGSIIKKIKRCMTRSEWKVHERLVQDEIFRAINERTCTDHGC